MNIEFLAPARDEFVAAVEHYEEQASRLGAELVDEVEEKLDSLRDNPRVAPGTPKAHDASHFVGFPSISCTTSTPIDS